MGGDKIPKRFVKNGSPILFNVLVDLFTKLYNGETKIPEEWFTSRGIYLHKSGETAVLDNYRPIMITCTLAKLYSALLNNRLCSFAEASNLLSDNQQGARPSRCTSDNIFILQQIREECVRRGEQCICAFLGFSTAFDRVIEPNFTNYLKCYISLSSLFEPSKTLHKSNSKVHLRVCYYR